MPSHHVAQRHLGVLPPSPFIERALKVLTPGEARPTEVTFPRWPGVYIPTESSCAAPSSQCQSQAEHGGRSALRRPIAAIAVIAAASRHPGGLQVPALIMVVASGRQWTCHLVHKTPSCSTSGELNFCPLSQELIRRSPSPIGLLTCSSWALASLPAPWFLGLFADASSKRGPPDLFLCAGL